MTRAKAVLVGLLLVVLAAAPATAATVRGQWAMGLDSTTSTVTRAQTGGFDMDLQGSYSEVPGAVGDAIQFGLSSVGTVRTGDFDPGAAPFAVAAYVKTPTVPTTGDYSPNVVQKGLFSSTGQWKMQLKPTATATIAGCRFLGSKLPQGDLVEDQSHTRLDDGRWHEVVCWREETRYGITVDGTETARTGVVGTISTTAPVRVANKTPAAGVQDQFQGIIDCIAYVDGASARATAQARVPC